MNMPKKMKAIQNQIDELRKTARSVACPEQESRKEKASAANGNAYAKGRTPRQTRDDARRHASQRAESEGEAGPLARRRRRHAPSDPAQPTPDGASASTSYVDKEVIAHGVLESHRVKLFRPRLFQLPPDQRRVRVRGNRGDRPSAGDRDLTQAGGATEALEAGTSELGSAQRFEPNKSLQPTGGMTVFGVQHGPNCG